MSADDEYAALVRRVLNEGVERTDRTGIGTLSIFGHSMKFNLAESFPLLTTKRVFFRGVVEELLWMLRGCTSSTQLAEKGVHIWDANGTKEFLKSSGLNYQEGDLGPIYGHQWRHFNAPYNGSDKDYSGQGVDQIEWLLNEIRTNPTSRRLVLSAWNPAQNSQMALPPCHTLCQFYANPDTMELSCMLYQRSGDVGLGVPFNIASYALLTHLVAKSTGYTPKDLVHTIGDAHIYTTHCQALRAQLDNISQPPPTLEVLTAKSKLEGYNTQDIQLHGYNPSHMVKMAMAV